MSKLNILYISKYCSVENYETRYPRTFQLLKGFQKKGHNVTLTTSDSNHLVKGPTLTTSVYHENVVGVDVYWLKTYKYTLAKSLKRILSWLDFEWQLYRFTNSHCAKPDVIIVSSLSLFSILNGIRLKHRYNCPFILEIRDIWPLTLTEVAKVSPRHPLIKILAWLERLGYNHADAIVGTMPNLVEHVRNVTSRDISVHCIPMGISDKQISDTTSLTQQPDSVLKIFYAGSLGVDNALDCFFSAIKLLRDDCNFHFYILGDGDLKCSYQERFSHYKNISFLEKVAKENVHSILQQADLLYFSTFDNEVWRYGQSLNKIIDYMLAAKPILASYSGHPSMINEANCGLFISANDSSAIVKALQKFKAMPYEDRQSMGLRGREWVIKHRNFNTLSQNYLEIIESIIKK